MMKLFSRQSPWFPFRWFLLVVLVLSGLLVYHNLTGQRILNFNRQQQWNASGPGNHK
ncbi:MAG TPA: hypothetical protein VHK69_06415 [Chitinophagaceae bacterium]|jgi:hypothetical protein|nr:hypothetical protein [Chitinophagaceae bacterium]